MARPLSTTPAATPKRGSGWLWPGIIAAAVGLAYANSLHAPYLLDDLPGIASNTSIRDLGNLSAVMNPAIEIGSSGRPLLNLSFALIYSVSGASVVGFHLANLCLHALTALVAFGLVRRLIQLPWAKDRFGAAGPWLPAGAALLWALHPALTNAVTYASQLAEVLMALMYLLTLYGLVRSAEPEGRRGFWLGVSMTACWLGMMSKETMITAPFMAFCLDWAFISGGAWAALRGRPAYYAGLAASWVLLGVLLATLSHHSIGLHVGVSPWTYLLTETEAITHYAQIIVVPYPLVFDFGPLFAHALSEVLVPGVVVLALLGLTLWALARRSYLGFAGVWFFVILSPTSSVVPVGLMPIAESRDYLPSLGVLVAAALVAYARWGMKIRPFLFSLAALAALVTVLRNEDYATSERIWLDTVAHAPRNARARDHLGNAYDAQNKTEAALAQYRMAVSLDPAIGTYDFNVGRELEKLSRDSEAEEAYRTAIRLTPQFQPSRVNLATLLAKKGDNAEARSELETAVQMRPKDYQAYYNLGLNLFTSGKTAEAAEQFRKALEIKPEALEPRNALGTALVQMGQPTEALEEFKKALALDTNSAITRVNVGNVLLATGRGAEAKEQFAAALQSDPKSSDASTGLGLCAMEEGQASEAADRFQTSLRLNPDDAEAHFRLGNLLAMSGHVDQAVLEWQNAIRLKPGNAEAHNNLAYAYSQSGRLDDAIAQYREALRIRPDYAQAKANLDDLLAQKAH